jgi:hypothetical protein
MKKILPAAALFFSITAGIAFADHHAVPETTAVQPYLQEVIGTYPGVRDIAVAPSGTEFYFSLQSYAGEISAMVFITRKQQWRLSPDAFMIWNPSFRLMD